MFCKIYRQPETVYVNFNKAVNSYITGVLMT